MGKDDNKAPKTELVKILLENEDEAAPEKLGRPADIEIDLSSRATRDDQKTTIENSREAPTKIERPTLSERISPKTATVAPQQSHVSRVGTLGSRTAGPRTDTRASSSVTHLAHSEHLRIAQDRIRELEDLIESLRLDNEGLSSAAETLKDRNDELMARLDANERRMREMSESFQREREHLDAAVKSKTREVNQLKLKVEDLESRLNNDLRKIRVRERELENIIEIVRAEHSAVIVNKDEIILNLKRKIDELTHQLETQLSHVKDQERALSEDQDRIKRTVKALRVALVMLEGDEDDLGLKKVD